MAEADEYVALIRRGLVVACPTETQMGLLADALDAAAVERVYELKRRPPAEPLGLLAPSLEVAFAIADQVTPLARRLASEHWPGPLTLVFRARPGLPGPLMRDGKVAVRVPGHSPALTLVRAFGGPLTATSANPSGQPPARDGAEAFAMFGEGLAAVVPGEPPGGAPSTLVDVSGAEPVVLRRGAIELAGL